MKCERCDVETLQDRSLCSACEIEIREYRLRQVKKGAPRRRRILFKAMCNAIARENYKGALLLARIHEDIGEGGMPIVRDALAAIANPKKETKIET